MRIIFPCLAISCLFASAALALDPALTIYNQNFAVVRDTVPLDLKSGINQVRFAGTTMHLEPDSVVLRDPTGRRELQVLEQNYRADPVSQELLLSLFEGKTIDFETFQPADGHARREIIKGKIIRSGYVPHYAAMDRYNSQYGMQQMAYAASGNNQPIIEVDGQLRFTLPGQPLFPALGDDTILKPTLTWLIRADKPGKVDAELGYVTGGMSWHADYNLVAPEKGDRLDLVGWVTMDNQSGKSFENAKIKLIAGDVNKIQEQGNAYGRAFAPAMSEASDMRPPVTEKSFDEYHLYSLDRATTLLDRETKQVEFVRAAGIKSSPVYVYDGARINNRYIGWNYEMIRENREYGVESNPKVWVMREFENSETNQLGIPLPKGRMRFYRQDTDGQLEFTGENQIDHTPRGEKIRVLTGNAFDLKGERRRTNYETSQNPAERWVDESFEIKLRNHKTAPVEIRVVEHLYRWSNWAITQKSDTFLKTDAQTLEFLVQVNPDTEKTVTYTVHYSW